MKWYVCLNCKQLSYLPLGFSRHNRNPAHGCRQGWYKWLSMQSQSRCQYSIQRYLSMYVGMLSILYPSWVSPPNHFHDDVSVYGVPMYVPTQYLLNRAWLVTLASTHWYFRRAATAMAVETSVAAAVTELDLFGILTYTHSSHRYYVLVYRVMMMMIF